MAGLLIDTDPALGLRFSDVDDAIAIHFAVEAGLDLVGLTTCFGNASGEAVHGVARELGERFGVPVHRGADRPGQVDTEAVQALLAHTGTVLALAPLTNIAAALLRGARWERLVVLGGTNRAALNLRPVHTTEFNFALDPTAAMLVLERTDVLFPMEICRQIRFGPTELASLPDWLRAGCTHWLNVQTLRTGRRSFHPWDLLPAIYLAAPSLFTMRAARPVPLFGPLRKGRLRFEPGSTRVAIRVDAERMTAFWRNTIAAG